jgi:IS30 family transposase
MKKRKKLSKSERLEISILRSKKYSMREIARATDRSPNTISAELRRNRVCGTYNPPREHTTRHMLERSTQGFSGRSLIRTRS